MNIKYHDVIKHLSRHLLKKSDVAKVGHQVRNKVKTIIQFIPVFGQIVDSFRQ